MLAESFGGERQERPEIERRSVGSRLGRRVGVAPGKRQVFSKVCQQPEKRLGEEKIFTHLLGWCRCQSSQRRLQRKTHPNTDMSPSVLICLMKVNNGCKRQLFNRTRSSINQEPRSARGLLFTSVLLFDSCGAFLKSCTSENNKTNARSERRMQN